jgi:catechol 2,3-dioxygenase-like lactoylglutathione lyase family enzyme
LAEALAVERVDLITIPTRDPERACASYHKMLGRRVRRRYVPYE